MKRVFEDGSEFGPKELAVAVVAGAAIAAPLIALRLKYDDWRTRRIMRKHGWPEAAWKK